MPELPDVEKFRRLVDEHTTGRQIQAVEVHDSQSLLATKPEDVSALLTGRYLREPRRRGKFLVFRTAPSPRSRTALPSLLVHFGMTGLFTWCSRDTERHRHDRIVLSFGDDANGQLRYRDARKLTGIRWPLGNRRSNRCSASSDRTRSPSRAMIIAHC